MTNAEADALIATLPQPGRLRLRREGDKIVMEGGKGGSHAIRVSTSSGERLLVHWKAYVETSQQTLGSDYAPPVTAHPESVVLGSPARAPTRQRRRRGSNSRPPPDVYARDLIRRYGSRAAQIASNRYDAAETEATAAYYEQVLTEIGRARRAVAIIAGQESP